MERVINGVEAMNCENSTVFYVITRSTKTNKTTMRWINCHDLKKLHGSTVKHEVMACLLNGNGWSVKDISNHTERRPKQIDKALRELSDLGAVTYDEELAVALEHPKWEIVPDSPVTAYYDAVTEKRVSEVEDN